MPEDLGHRRVATNGGAVGFDEIAVFAEYENAGCEARLTRTGMSSKQDWITYILYPSLCKLNGFPLYTYQLFSRCMRTISSM